MLNASNRSGGYPECVALCNRSCIAILRAEGERGAPRSLKHNATTGTKDPRHSLGNCAALLAGELSLEPGVVVNPAGRAVHGASLMAKGRRSGKKTQGLKPIAEADKRQVLYDLGYVIDQLRGAYNL